MKEHHFQTPRLHLSKRCTLFHSVEWPIKIKLLYSAYIAVLLHHSTLLTLLCYFTAILCLHYQLPHSTLLTFLCYFTALLFFLTLSISPLYSAYITALLYQFYIFYVPTNFMYLAYPASKLYYFINSVHKLTESWH
jgi:hypothetical protein